MSIRKIAIIGLDKSEKAMLEAAVETASGFVTGLWQCADEQQDPEMIFLDPNSPEGESALKTYVDQKDAPLLVYCTEELKEKKQKQLARFSIKPPLSYSNIVPVLRKADSIVGKSGHTSTINKITTEPKEQSKPAHNNIDNKSNHKKPTQVEQKKTQHKVAEKNESAVTKSVEIEYLSESSELESSGSESTQKFYQLIEQIIKENRSVEISHPKFPPIRICSDRQWFIFPEDLSNYAMLFRTSADEFEVTDMGDRIRKQAFSGDFPKPLWELIYTSILLCATGKLLEPLDQDDLLYLDSQPEFDKVPHTPEHLIIASYLNYLSGTVETIAEDTAIEASIVIDFCNACQSIGLIIASAKMPNKLIQLINEAIEAKLSIEISHPEFPELQIFSRNNEFIFPANLAQHAAMFSRDINEFSVIEIENNIHNALYGLSPKALWGLIYTATLFTTRGKLVEPLRAEHRYCLAHPPEFDLVPHTQAHKKIAKYMTSYSDSIHVIAVNTRVDIPTIIDFCNACQAICILEKNSTRLFSSLSTEADTTMESNHLHDESLGQLGVLHTLLSNLINKS